MAHTKETLVQLLAPGLARETGSSEKEFRQILETYDIKGLERELDRQRREGLISQQSPQHTPQKDSDWEQRALAAIRATQEPTPELAAAIEARRQEQIKLCLIHIYRTSIDGRFARMCQANDDVILGWLHPGEDYPTAEWFKKVLAEQPSLANSIAWESADPIKRKQAAAAQLERDHQTFAEAAKTIRTFGVNEANLNVTRSVLGSGFTVYAIQQALLSNALQLSPPTQSEREEWLADDIERHNQELLQANPEQLKARVREEAEQRRAVDQQAEAEKALEAAQARDAARGGFPPLPTEITREKIRAASPSEIRLWLRKYGQYQLNKTLAVQEN
jgi:hypothetical protein